MRTKLVPPFQQPVGNQSYGLFIGNGDQDNYIKLVRVAGGLQLAWEFNGEWGSSPVYPLAQSFNALDLILMINPISGQVEAAYALDDGPIQSLTSSGLQVTAQGLVKAVLQSSQAALAVGMIGTKAGGQDYPVTYDFFEV
ncbi:MAG: hypothetical protein HC880_02515, partial [Bacteroidia bacterium]|nr:hypothetical protein [Bacteroidia bacterium]